MADGQGTRPAADQSARNIYQAQVTDWITICQSELACLATDREAQETWVRLVDLWAQTAERAARLLPAHLLPTPLPPTMPLATHDRAHGPAGPAAPPGPPPPVAAPDARDATIHRLAERIAELERRLAALSPPAGRPDPSNP
jgi:hypothetical protein